jgi:hypothetical protein
MLQLHRANTYRSGDVYIYRALAVVYRVVQCGVRAIVKVELPSLQALPIRKLWSTPSENLRPRLFVGL